MFGQEDGKRIEGQVTFLTTANVYVRFENTAEIQAGDSLRLTTTGKACLLVTSTSSTSCVCTVVNECTPEKGDAVFFMPSKKEEPEPALASGASPESNDRDMMRQVPQPEEALPEPEFEESYMGSLGLSSYHLLNSDRDDNHRFMARLALHAEHVDHSRFSFDSYLNYRYVPDANSTSLGKTGYFNVYSLNTRMDASPTLTFILGRATQPKAFSLGAIDGLQTEKKFGNLYLGGIIGFRPDLFDYGFNPDLLEYGGYFGIHSAKGAPYSETTLGFMEQRANGDIDRRYTYLQHSSNPFDNLNLFATAEMDIFSKVNYTTTNELRLTNLYVSARYRFSKNVNLMLSYDSRKRILYYETFQNEIEQLLDDDLARQGARARIGIRPFKYVYAGASYARRFQSDSQNKSDNINGYITFSRIPELGGRVNLSFNRNTSNYLESTIGAVRYSRDLIANRLYGDFYYRYVNYQYGAQSDPIQQHYAGVDLSYHLTRKLLFSISGEYTTYDNENNFRIYTRIVQRFNSN